MKKHLIAIILLMARHLNETNAFLIHPRASLLPANPGFRVRSTIVATTDALRLRDEFEFVFDLLYQKQQQVRLPSMRSLYERYLELLATRPIQTKAVSAAVISAIGNILGQLICAFVRNEAFCINSAHVVTFALINLLYVGPIFHAMYEQLWKVGAFMEARWGSSKLEQVCAQILLDQTFRALVFFPLYFVAFEFCEAFVGARSTYTVSASTNQATVVPLVSSQICFWLLFLLL